ncbi:TPA: hypothetical protein DEO28_01540 [Candidatus Dependentiae bacterium]|nr:MAG: hypothetical protein UR14_C0003G0155 [candidate division TM6 bacterium GW2011_GWE2_31_21]KKP53681.1 MAG: hypothetical protein UR43_C0003G0002 [candidate division TM6 bacterium GW2011_GWF2_33_332]HBS48567.1 hypothetical protein [Candidatus Dependentiae bacterium]HBZ73182.1 hypothetical protein [Candidatus Dependentiae bacterium]
MSIAFDGEELIYAIIYDARDRYGFKDGYIIFNRDKIAKYPEDLDLVIGWVDWVLDREKTAQYKFLGDNKIEIKEYFFSPSKEVCEKVISFILNTLDACDYENALFNFGYTLYKKRELIKAINFDIKEGYFSGFVLKYGDEWNEYKELLVGIKIHKVFMQTLDLYSAIREGYFSLERV